MVYNELCHKEIDWSKTMKQLLITLVGIVLVSTVLSSYAGKCKGEKVRACSKVSLSECGHNTHYIHLIRTKCNEDGDDCREIHYSKQCKKIDSTCRNAGKQCTPP